MKEEQDYKKAEKMIEEANKMKVLAIRRLLVKGYTLAEIAMLLNKNSRQSIYQFYRYHTKKVSS